MSVNEANGVFTTLPLSESFLTSAQKYNATVKSVAKESAPERAHLMNAWCSKETKGVIRQIIKKKDCIKKTAVWILNAIYFKGKWDTPFEMSGKRPFNGSWKTYRFMKSKSDPKYYANDKLQAVRFPYIDKKWSASIILPRKGVALSSIVDENLHCVFGNLTANAPDFRYRVFMPAFQAEWQGSLVGALQKNGVEKAFMSHSANFDTMCAEPPCRLSIENAVQKAVLKVSPMGTVAVAVTGVAVATSAVVALPDPEPIIVDRPFLFVITHEENVVFMSAINDPEELSEDDMKEFEKESIPVVVSLPKKLKLPKKSNPVVITSQPRVVASSPVKIDEIKKSEEKKYEDDFDDDDEDPEAWEEQGQDGKFKESKVFSALKGGQDEWMDTHLEA